MTINPNPVVRRWWRHYIDLVDTHIPFRQWGQWGDIEVSHQQYSHVTRPRDLAGAPYVLVETSRYGQTWITIWASPEAAANYHVNQEYADDWDLAELVDIRTGDQFQIELKPVVTKVVAP